MSINTKPPFPVGPHNAWSTVMTTAATGSGARDGTHGNVVPVTFASKIEHTPRILMVPKGDNVATSVRFFLNNGSTHATATNNVPVFEMRLPAVTFVAGTPMPVVEWEPENFVLEEGQYLYACLTADVVGGWQAVSLGRRFEL